MLDSSVGGCGFIWACLLDWQLSYFVLPPWLYVLSTFPGRVYWIKLTLITSPCIIASSKAQSLNTVTFWMIKGWAINIHTGGDLSVFITSFLRCQFCALTFFLLINQLFLIITWIVNIQMKCFLHTFFFVWYTDVQRLRTSHFGWLSIWLSTGRILLFILLNVR